VFQRGGFSAAPFLSLVPTGKSLFNEERERFRHGIVTPAIETASRATRICSMRLLDARYAIAAS
jgi:hypothetical protein